MRMDRYQISGKFRSASGSRYTRTLFVECQRDLPADQCPTEPMFSLNHAYGDLPCFRHLYVSYGDPTGYQLAINYLEDYDHWRLLLKSPWFLKAKEVWDAELDAKLSSEGLATIRSYADGIEGVSPALQLTAAKYLSDKAYRKTPAGPKRGRPSAIEVAGHLAQEASDAADIAGDLARIRSVK